MSKKLLVLAALILMVGLGLYFMPKTTTREDKDYDQASLLVNEGNPNQALTIIQNYQDQFSDIPGKDQWLSLFIKAIAKDPELAKNLARLYQKYPNYFLKIDEDSALQAASGLIGIKDFEGFETLKNGWKNKTENPAIWNLLTIDRIQASGDKALAQRMLEKETYTGNAEVLRLMRLSFLNENTDLKKSWEYLTQAVSVDPKNPDLRSLRASILERIGKVSLAQEEYQAALQLNPSEPKLWDQQAQFYIRQGQWALALLTWEKALKLSKSEKIWVNLLFWSKVVRPIKFDLNPSNLRESKLKSFINYLYNLPEDQFWDTEAYQKVEFGAQLLGTEQETFWLRLLQALKENKTKDAFDLIAFNPFRSSSFRPDLEFATASLIQYQNEGNFNLPDVVRGDFMQSIIPSLLTNVQSHQLLKLLSPSKDEKNLDAKTEALLKSPIAFSALYAAGGWYGASLKLNFPEVVPDEMPSWVPFTLTQALRVIKGNNAALQYALKQPSSDEINFLKGEIYSSLNQDNEAEKLLVPLAKNLTPIGIKSAWDLVDLYIKQNKPDEAQAIINMNSSLKESVLGKELSARIAVIQGNNDKALELFSSIVSESYEAKAYLANYYMKNDEWTKAEALILDLLKQYPNSPQIQKLYQQLENHKKSN